MREIGAQTAAELQTLQAQKKEGSVSKEQVVSEEKDNKLIVRITADQGAQTAGQKEGSMALSSAEQPLSQVREQERETEALAEEESSMVSLVTETDAHQSQEEVKSDGNASGPGKENLASVFENSKASQNITQMSSSTTSLSPTVSQGGNLGASQRGVAISDIASTGTSPVKHLTTPSSTLTAPAGEEKHRRRRQGNQSHQFIREALEYQRRKSANLAGVVSETIQTINYLDQQLYQVTTEARETEIILQDRVQTLENRVADLSLQNQVLTNSNQRLANANQYLLNNPAAVFYASPIVVVEQPASAPAAGSLRLSDLSGIFRAS